MVLIQARFKIWTLFELVKYHSFMIKNVTLQNYRNIAQLTVDFDPGVNLVIAPNGSGKTNLVESIYFMSYNKVFRSIAEINQLILAGKDFARVSIELQNQSELEKFIAIEGGITSTLNKKAVPASKLGDKIPVLLFAPASVNIVDGESSVRRDDLDSFLSKIDGDYRITLTEYKKIIKQRNAQIKLIRDGEADYSGMNFWDTKLIDLSCKLYALRMEYIEALNDTSEEIDLERYTPVRISHKEHVDVSGSDDRHGEYKRVLEEKIATGRHKELGAGKSLYGAHRDEISIYMNDIDLRYLGSRGQQRVGAFIYKLTQYFLLKRKKEEIPVFLIDDLMSELDTKNREICGRIIVKNIEQCILTSAEESEIDSITKSVGKFVGIVGD